MLVVVLLVVEAIFFAKFFVDVEYKVEAAYRGTKFFEVLYAERTVPSV